MTSFISFFENERGSPSTLTWSDPLIESGVFGPWKHVGEFDKNGEMNGKGERYGKF
jgi:hypothetical protein